MIHYYHKDYQLDRYR